MNNLKFFLLGFMLWGVTSNAQSLDTRKSFILVGTSVKIPKEPHHFSLWWLQCGRPYPADPCCFKF